jgi:hypothetical protein
MTSISTRFTSVISVMSNSSKLSRSTQMKSAITVTQMKTAASNSFQSPAALKTNFGKYLDKEVLQKCAFFTSKRELLMKMVLNSSLLK